jgi:spore maturation protein CgeB
VATLQERHTEEIQQLIAARDNQLAERDRQVATLQERHTEEIEQLTAAKNDQLAERDGQIATLLERIGELERQHANRLKTKDRQVRDLLARKDSKLRWGLVTQRVKDVVRRAVPEDRTVLVVSKGDDDLLKLDGRSGWHFPQAAGGVYAGHHPGDSAQAIKQLETLRGKGADFFLIPASAFWWLDFYPEFREHLEQNYRPVAYEEDACIIYALGNLSADDRSRLAVSVHAMNGGHGSATNVGPGDKVATSLRADRTQRTAASQPNAATQPQPAATRVARSRPRLGVVLDEFTTDCFRHESELTTFRPDNWQETLEAERPDALFVESAWRGNDGAWLYRVAQYARNMGDELAALVAWAKANGIPSMFWNKEDPVHFDRFIKTAALFENVFTTDADCIPRYRERLGHSRVFALPFAAQPAIHNPILTGRRDGTVCFAGTYYGDRHEQRRSDMDYILKPALSFGLEIYDRQHGVTGKNAEIYQFPEIYQPSIKGRLEYDQMVQAYKRYRVFLNVNSVKNSPTMCARRVFELLACGTPVISTYSRAIVDLLGDDVVFIAESEEDTRKHLEHLLNDDNDWARASVRGIRKVMRGHLYRDRLRQAFEVVGLKLPDVQEPRFTVVVRVGSAADLQLLPTLLGAQTYQQFEVVIVSNTRLSDTTIEPIRNALSGRRVVNLFSESSDLYLECVGASNCEHIAFADLRDSYGPEYLADYALALAYSGADLVGKHTFWHVGTNVEERRIGDPGREFTYVSSVPSATLVVKKAVLTREMFQKVLGNRVFKIKGRQILSIDRFNYLQNAVVGAPLEANERDRQLAEVSA